MSEAIETTVAVLGSQLDDVKRGVDAGFIMVNKKLDCNATEIGNITKTLNTIGLQYVTKSEFIEYKNTQGISKLVTTLLTVILTATITGLIYNVINHYK